jgi:hypothetical protein
MHYSHFFKEFKQNELDARNIPKDGLNGLESERNENKALNQSIQSKYIYQVLFSNIFIKDFWC